jgi:hypothetical protein
LVQKSRISRLSYHSFWRSRRTLVLTCHLRATKPNRGREARYDRGREQDRHPALRTSALAAAAGGALYVFTGALQATHDFAGIHNTLDSTAEYLVTGTLAAALFLVASMYLHLGRMAGTPRAGVAAAIPQLVIGAMCVSSVISGEDAAFFNAVAPASLLTWLIASVVLARGLLRTKAVPKPIAYALPALLIVTFPMSVVGGPILTGAYWMVVGTRLVPARAMPASAQPASSA